MRTITMLDEDSKPFNRTYPRRAENLVKKGRAKWVDPNSIIMTSSTPSQNLEDEEMSDTTNLEMLLEQILDRIAKLEEKLDYISSPNLSVLEGGVKFEAGIGTVVINTIQEGGVKFGDSDIESIALTSTGKIDISQVNEMRTENCNFDIAEIRNATNLSTE